MAVALGVTGLADDLAPLVDPGRLARDVAGECIELTNSAAPGPDERARIEVAAAGGGRVGEADHGALLVDRHRRVPGDAPEVADVARPTAMVPDHVVDCAEPAGRLVADAGDSDHASEVVQSRRSRDRVPGQRPELAH